MWRKFSATELNAPFYRTPTEKAVENWRSSTPETFRFAWKASKFITHWRRLIVDEKFHAAPGVAAPAARRQARTGAFPAAAEDGGGSGAAGGIPEGAAERENRSFEFRHRAGTSPPIFRLLSDHNVSLCLSDHADAPAPCEVTAGWVYIRNHGPGGRYHGSYSDGQSARGPSASGNGGVRAGSLVLLRQRREKRGACRRQETARQLGLDTPVDGSIAAGGARLAEGAAVPGGAAAAARTGDVGQTAGTFGGGSFQRMPLSAREASLNRSATGMPARPCP